MDVAGPTTLSVEVPLCLLLSELPAALMMPSLTMPLGRRSRGSPERTCPKSAKVAENEVPHVGQAKIFTLQ